MLVLRRRPNEAIVFDGKTTLSLSLTSVSPRLAWVAFNAEDFEQPIEIGIAPAGAERAELSIRAPRSSSRQGATTTVVLGPPEEHADAVLSLTRQPGETIVIGPLAFELSAIEDEKAYLELRTASLAVPVTLSIVTMSSVDAWIGVDAPGELRVYRSEVWAEMQAANTAAAGRWSEEDLAALLREAR